MVAAGTGLAPFRGAIADRRARMAEGTQLPSTLCYFGCDDPDADYHAAEAAGAVSLGPAFSADPVECVTFVRHRTVRCTRTVRRTRTRTRRVPRSG